MFAFLGLDYLTQNDFQFYLFTVKFHFFSLLLFLKNIPLFPITVSNVQRSSLSAYKLLSSPTPQLRKVFPQWLERHLQAVLWQE